MKIDVFRRPGYALYPAIVEQCVLDTNVSPDGQSQTQVQFKLRTKSLFLQVKLPPRPKLWSAELDGVPLKPQRGERLRADRRAGRHGRRRPHAANCLRRAGRRRRLPAHGDRVGAQAVCTPGVRGQGSGVRGQGSGAGGEGKQQLPSPFGRGAGGEGGWQCGRLRAVSSREPALTLALSRKEGAATTEIPLADAIWRLHLPNGYEAIRRRRHDGGRPRRPAPTAAGRRPTGRLALRRQRRPIERQPLGRLLRCPRSGASNGVPKQLEAAWLGRSQLRSGKKVFDAPVGGYPQEVEFTDEGRRATAIAKIAQEIRSKRRELRSLASEVGGVDADSLALRSHHAYDQLNALANQSAAIQSKVAEVRSELEANKALLSSVEKPEQRSTIEQEIGKREAYLAVLQKSQEELADNIRRTQADAVKPGRSTVNSEMLRAEIKELEMVQAKMSAQRGELTAGLKAKSIPASPAAKGDVAGEETEKPSPESTLSPPIVYPGPETWQQLTARRKEKYAALTPTLLGMRSLKIDVQQTPAVWDRVIKFRSLGVALRCYTQVGAAIGELRVMGDHR